MNKHTWLACICALVLLAGCGKKEAEEQPAPPLAESPEAEHAPVEDIGVLPPELTAPLTDAEVTSFVEAFPEAARHAKGRSEELHALGAITPLKGLQAWQIARQLGTEAEEILNRHGLTVEQFSDISARVIQAFSAATMQQQIAKMEADLAEMKGKLDDPETSEAEKESIRLAEQSIARIRQEIIENLSAPRENIEMVRKHMRAIERMFAELQ